MSETFKEIRRLAGSNDSGIEQNKTSTQQFIQRDAVLSRVFLERRAIHDEIVELLQAYSLWMDSFSEEMVRLIDCSSLSH